MKLVSNPPNPYCSTHRELLEPSPPVLVEIYEEETGSILSRNESPDLPFRWSINPYRGCFHACAYCYARPTHEYWGFGAGTDFESKIIVKPNAANALRDAFLHPSWKGELIAFSGNTDCYQPLEATYELTRSCLETCADFCNPVSIVTKAALIQRDIDILTKLKERAWVRVFLSIPFADNETARKVEPQAPSITKRFETIAHLSQAGISTHVLIAPVIPGLNEHDIPAILHRAKEMGAVDASFILLRLNANVEPVFLERMQHMFPNRIKKIVNRLKETRGGTLSETRFFTRHRGEGPTWLTIRQLFDAAYRKVGFPLGEDLPIPETFIRPGHPQQQSLF